MSSSKHYSDDLEAIHCTWGNFREPGGREERHGQLGKRRRIPITKRSAGLACKKVSNVSRQHMIMAEQLDLQDSKALLESWSFQKAQQRLIYEILGQMQREEAVTN